MGSTTKLCQCPLDTNAFTLNTKQWIKSNSTLSLQGKNIRDTASINELVVLSNLESQNAELIKKDISRDARLKILTNIAFQQLKIFD